SAWQAATTAQLHDAVPIEPPESMAMPKSLSPMRTSTASIGTPSVSAATWVSTVRAPVPTSAAVTRTVKVPSGSALAGGLRRARPRREARGAAAGPQQPAAAPASPRPGIARRPAEAAGALAQAIDQAAAAEGETGRGLHGRLTAHPQLDRVDPGRVGQL